MDFNESTVPGPVENKDKSRFTRFRRFLIASTIPLALLAAGCSGQSSSKPDSVPGGSKIGEKQHNQDIEKAEKKMLTDCLMRVAGGESSFDILDNGDFALMAGGNYYRLDTGAKEQILLIVKENAPSTDLGSDFKRAEEKIQTEVVKKAVKNIGQPMSLEELTPKLQDTVKNAQSIHNQLNKQKSVSRTKDAGIGPQVWTNPDAKDFL